VTTARARYDGSRLGPRLDLTMSPRGHGFIPSSAEDVLRRRVKIELRKRMRGLRKALPAQACSERSSRICGRLEALPALARARTVALFWPMQERHEIDLRPLSTSLLDRGLRVAFPLIDPETGAMTFHFVEDVTRMVDGSSGLREPSPDEPVASPGALDVIVVPALAVDPRGHRIGYGRGHYDRTLPAFAPPASTVAVAFDFQLVSEVPNMEGDVTVEWIVTDSRTMEAEASP
jgi:5-formyltetrahydrofolate cyclo-ligase